MKRFILDTNLFFNMEPGTGLGRQTEEVVIAVTGFIKKLKGEAEFYMSPRIREEFLSFFEDKSQGFINDFFAEVKIKSPEIAEIQFPAAVFYKLVEDIRARSYRGLNIAEEELKNISKLLNSQITELPKAELEKKSGTIISKLRERYRQATRYGFLDSLADLDLIVLAKELDATLVTADEGVFAWGRVFGVEEMDAPSFGHWLKSR